MNTEKAAHSLNTRNRFFAPFSILLAIVLIAGFARTFFLQPLFATPSPTLPLVIHGICGTSWFALLIVQAGLVRRGKGARHRELGRRVGPPLAVIAILSAIWIVVLNAMRAKVTGSGLPVPVALFIQTGTMTWFAVLAGLGFSMVKRPDYHKRFMIMATIAMLAPAYSRIARLLVSGRAPIDSAFISAPLIALLFWHDWRSLGRIHPVTLYAGLGYLIYVALRLPIAQSDLWTKTIVPAVFGI